MTAKFSTQARYRYYSADHAHRYAKHVASRTWEQMTAAGDDLYGINWRPRPVQSPRPAGHFTDPILLLKQWRKSARSSHKHGYGYGEIRQAVVSPVLLP